MKKIILFGAGFYGKNAYYKLKNQFEILFFADNNPALDGTELFGIQVIAGKKLKEIYSSGVDIIICSGSHFQISAQLIEMGITEYYVMLEGFLYHNSDKETMIPVELNNYSYYRKEKKEKNILYMQDTACIRTHKIASMMKDEGYKVYLLYTMAPPESNNESYAGIYSGIFSFSSMGGIIDFIENSDFDIIHSSNEPDILTNIALKTSKHVVFDTHDMNSLWGHDSIENLALEYVANTQSDGNIYTSTGVVEIAKQKYGLEQKEIFSLENMILDQEEIKDSYEKLSDIDHEIHCVYEGGMNGTDKASDRFFEPLWEKITECGIHIHFYSQADPVYCRKLDGKSEYLHYEGNMESKKLVREMTKYDCGLAIFQVTEQNRNFLETGTANKVYEYINSQIPVVVSELESYINFVEQYNVGINLDFSKDIKEQIKGACQIKISPDFLRSNHLTMKSRQKELADFYERVKKREVFRRKL